MKINKQEEVFKLKRNFISRQWQINEKINFSQGGSEKSGPTSKSSTELGEFGKLGGPTFSWRRFWGVLRISLAVEATSEKSSSGSGRWRKKLSSGHKINLFQSASYEIFLISWKILGDLKLQLRNIFP